MWEKAKICWEEKWATFESLNGALMILWGIGFVYYSYEDIPKPATFDSRNIWTWPINGYDYAEFTVGIILIIWGLRKTTVNRIKQEARKSKLVSARLQRETESVILEKSSGV